LFFYHTFATQLTNKNYIKMKGLTKFLAGAFAVALLASCGGKNGADKAATEYLNALKDKNYTKAKELGTKNTQDMLDALTSMNMAPQIDEVKDVKCTETEEGKKASCTYCCAKDGKNTLNLVKEGEKWLVDEKKEGGAPSEDIDMEEPAPADSGAASTEAAPAEEGK
jgi:hypothetical protein